jgi:polyisoprenoid-binding protein YceI
MKAFITSSILFALFTFSCKSSESDDASGEDNATSQDRPAGVAYHIDVPRSEVKWQGTKITRKHHGIIPVSGGVIYVDGDILTGGNVEMNMSGLEVRDLEGEMKAKLEGHLKGTTPGREDDFFNVGKYPTASFTVRSSDKLVNDPEGTHMVQGDLKIRDITKPVSFKATLDMGSGSAIKATSVPFTIDRTEWGVKFESKKFFDNLKDDFIHDDVTLEIIIGAIKSND